MLRTAMTRPFAFTAGNPRPAELRNVIATPGPSASVQRRSRPGRTFASSAGPRRATGRCIASVTKPRSAVLKNARTGGVLRRTVLMPANVRKLRTAPMLRIVRSAGNPQPTELRPACVRKHRNARSSVRTTAARHSRTGLKIADAMRRLPARISVNTAALQRWTERRLVSAIRCLSAT